MLFFRLAGVLPKLVFTSFVIWVVLSTAIPQVMLKTTSREIRSNRFSQPTYPYNSITSPAKLPIQNSTVYFVVGHPDDEVMFFSPSIIELAKPKHNNDVRLICFSKGDAVHESMGTIREQELYTSARILGLTEDKVTVLTQFKDGMNESWPASDIATSLRKVIGSQKVVLVTFDENGVSKHPNHISLYHGTRRFYKSYGAKKLYVLKSLNFWEKYSFTLLTNVELFVDHLSKFVFSFLKVNINISFFNQNLHSNSIKFYSDLNMLSLSYAAMSFGHFSQMVWFRYGWLILSRYLSFNHLIEV